MNQPMGIERFGNLSQEEFAGRCRAARGYANLTLEQAGKLMGLSRQALSRREAGWVNIHVSDRFVMAKVYCELTGWPESVFTQEAWPLAAPAEAEVEPGEVADLVVEPRGDAAQG